MAEAQTAADSIRRVLDHSGLLFQPHPSLPGWKTTRPGALSGEIVAFKNTKATPTFARLSIRYHQAGETDEDNYTYNQDTWIVETMDKATDEHDVKRYTWGENDSFTDRDKAIERVVEIMKQVADERGVTGE